ncbi:MAG: six-cysteine ranthipeptide SCIFF [Firmicutes bacterium]|nr:six-cysteine ranthipeptide SCIFF [Bacillota bacterium]
MKTLATSRKHITTITSLRLQETARTGGCGECQNSCQSACKTSCTVGNQACERDRQEG